MKSRLIAAVAATVLLASAGAASADIVTLSPPAGDGSLSGTFSETGLGAGAFSVTFTFSLPESGFTAGTITSVATSDTTNVDFTGVSLNGVDFSVGTTGTTEFQFLPGIFTTSGDQTLVVNGTSGGDGAFSGTVAFTPGAPEPAGWALMILGVGVLGASLRQRRRAGLSLA